MGKTAKIILPDTYYLDYFNFVLEYVETYYLKILQEDERIFIKYFKQLSFDSQCLYIRMANRKGTYFRPSKLVYREIKNVSLAIDELRRREFISHNDFDDHFSLLNLFTKPEIIQLSKLFGWDEYFKSTFRKEDIIILILENEAPENVISNLSTYDPIISMKKVEELEIIKLLFFGHHYGDMSEFVVRDIGHAKIEKYNPENFTPHFSTREEVDTYWYITQAYRNFKLMIALEVAPIDIYNWYQELDTTYIKVLPKSVKLLGKFTNKLGYLLEQSEHYEEALHVYKTTSVHPSLERQLRLMKKLGREEQALSLANQILDSSKNQKEIIFAQDFLNSIGKARISRSTTNLLKQGKELTIIKEGGLKVEDQVIKHFQSQGYEAMHSENFIWRSLFGLTLWEIIFDESLKSIHNPLQRAPSDLHDTQFFAKREHAIDRLFQRLRSKKQLLQIVESTYNNKYGISNPFVYWHEELTHVMEKFIEFLPFNALKEVIIQMAQNTKENSTGFPDLFVYNEKSYHLYEVKSPNDHLSDQQLFWINFMKKRKIKVDILKIRWTD